MSDVTRRDAVKLAAVGTAAAAGGMVSAASATAQEPGKAAAASLEKVTASLIATASKVAAAAGTPEEAYKRFMTVAGKGMMQVMANALAVAVAGGAEATKGKKSEGWEKFVKGCAMTFDFGAPIDLAAVARGEGGVLDFQKVLVTKLQDNVQPTEEAAKLLGGSISVGGTWSF